MQKTDSLRGGMAGPTAVGSPKHLGVEVAAPARTLLSSPRVKSFKISVKKTVPGPKKK